MIIKNYTISFFAKSLKLQKHCLCSKLKFMNKHFLIILLLALSIACLYQCTYDKADSPEPKSNNESESDSSVDVCDTLKPSFKGDVQPIFENSCTIETCHNQTYAADGKVFETYEQISEGVANGPVLCALEGVDCRPMPQGNFPLSSDKIQTIECWAADGAPNN